MQIAQIGPWEFEMPEGWQHKPNETSNSYFESEDGTSGMYVKSIALSEPKPTPAHLARYVQDIHFSGFTEGTTNSWEVVEQRMSTEGGLARSALDILDSSANYRVLSLVLATSTEAVQISIHDYWCEDYAASQHAYSSLEASLVRVASAALYLPSDAPEK